MKARRLPLGWFLALAAGLLLIMVWEFAATLGEEWVSLTDEGSHQLLNACSRALSQLVGLIFASVALAVPIAATGYTPKLIQLFISDRRHQIALSYFALAAVHANWVLYLVRREPVPEGLVTLVLISTMAGFLTVVPYFLYVIRFLEPRTVISRITVVALSTARKALGSPRQMGIAHTTLPRHLAQIGGVVLKAVDRIDRRSTVQGVEAIREVLRAYGEVKDRLPPSWFEVHEREFPGLSNDALAFISADRAWIEVSANRQLIRAFEYALPRLPDAVSAIAAAIRSIAEDAMSRRDLPAVETCVRTFNTFLRSAVRRKEPHAIFDALTHYRGLAQHLSLHAPAITTEIAQYFSYYGMRTREAGMAFIPELFAYDLVGMLRHLVDVHSESTPGVTDALVGFMRQLANQPTVSLGCAGLIALAWLSGRVDEGQLERIAEVMEEIPRDILAQALSTIERTRHPRFWEMTDRQEDFNYLPEPQLAALQSLIERRFPALAATSISAHRSTD